MSLKGSREPVRLCALVVFIADTGHIHKSLEKAFQPDS